MSINIDVTYTCFRVGCAASATVPLDELLYDEDGDERAVRELAAFAPEGWVWECSGVDDVLHCPDHVAGP